MTQRLERFGLSALFAICGVWLCAFGLGFLFLGEMPWWTEWAWEIPVGRVFDHLAPIVSIGFWVGATLESSRAQVPCYLAGAAVYFAAAFALISGKQNLRKLTALACWMNVMSVLFRIFSFIIHGESYRWLVLDLAILMAYGHLGFALLRRPFVPEKNV